MLGPPRHTLRKEISISVAEEMKTMERNHKQLQNRHKKKKKVKMNFADILDMKVLKKIRKRFLQGGSDALTCEDFIEVLSEYIPRSDVESLYKKIDVNDDGMVDWEEFTGFLISSEGGGTGDFLTKNSIQQFVLQWEQDFESRYQHTDMIEHMAHGTVPFPILATAGKDGQVLLWNPKTLQYINSIDHRDKSRVFLDNITKSMTQADMARMRSRGANLAANKKGKSYITALAILPITGHICLSTADCCITIYDSPSLELTGRIANSTDVPTTMQAFAVTDKIRLINTQYLAIGNSKGKIIVITLDDSFVLATDGPLPKKQNQEIWEKAVKKKYKWKIHKDWVTQLMYISEINRLVSCSLDGTIVLSTIATQPSARVFNGHDTGVRCFAWSNASKILCSAGTDRSVLIWDPFTLQIAHRIENLSSMIILIHINDLSQQIAFVMQDKLIKTWDSLTYECLNASEDPSVQLPKNEISAGLWVRETETLYTAGNRVCSFINTTVINETSANEDDDICKVLYNVNFYETITVTKAGWVNVYFVGDGSSDSSFLITNSMQQKGAVGVSSLSIIDAVLDKVQRRLIVATNENNEIQIWNFHSGLCIKVIRPRIVHSLSQHMHLFPPDKKTFHITCLHYEHTFLGNQKTNKRMLMFGTDLGVVSVLLELPEDISEEPAFNLVTQADGRANSNSSSKQDNSNKKQLRFPVHNKEENNDQIVVESSVVSFHESTNHQKHEQQQQQHQQQSTKAVLWIRESCTNNVLVAYGNGTVIDWNLEKGVRNVKIKASDVITGVGFAAFRRKFAMASDRNSIINPSNSSTTSTTENPSTSISRADAEKDDLFPLSDKETREVSETDPLKLVPAEYPPASGLSLSQNTFSEKKNNQIKNNSTIANTSSSGGGNASGVTASPIRKPPSKKQPKARANGPRRITSSEKSRTLLVTYGNHYEKQIAVAESGQESWTTSLNNRIGGLGGGGAGAGTGAGGSGVCFKAAIVGVAKHSNAHADFPSLNPLLPDILSPRYESEPIGGGGDGGGGGGGGEGGGNLKISFHNHGRSIPVPPAAAVGGRGDGRRSVLTSGDLESKMIPNSHKINAWGDMSINDPMNVANDSNGKHKQPTNQTVDDAKEEGESNNITLKNDVAAVLQQIMPPSTPLTHTHHATEKEKLKKSYLLGNRKASKEKGNRQPRGLRSSGVHVGVTCMVSLKIARIAIGACTDSLFRFWDLDTVKVICSCSVGLELKTVKDGTASSLTGSSDAGGAGGGGSKTGGTGTRNDMQLNCLTLSPNEELLIGGYDNGEIRIWIVSMASINNIRITQKEIISGMSVPPIQLLNEWTGHDSSVRSIDVVVLDEDNWGSHELYLVSSGQDQQVHLWTVSGEHVGTFGASKGWDLEEKSTWKVNTDKYKSGNHFFGGGGGGFTPSGPPSTPGRSRPSYWRKGSHANKVYRIDPNDTDTNYFRMAKLNRHMEKVKIKNHKKLTDPSTTEIHCEMVNSAQARNPMTEVSEEGFIHGVGVGGFNGKPSSPSRRGKSAVSSSRTPTTTPSSSAK